MSKIERGPDFIRAIVERDLESGRFKEVVTRFPPEPNGYLHIGHAKAISVNFGLSQEFPGRTHLRFDDTNPITEEGHYARAMQEDVRWLGYDWGEHLYYASDYFERMYEAAVTLIEKGLAYVDSQTEEEIRENRGTVTEPGRPGPYRDRSVEENLDLFRRMRAGEFRDGEHVLRAKIDLAHPNMVMRDPVLYRIRHAHHYRTGDDWCIYPLYDFAHCLEDAFEEITHSLCTLEFENNREIYDWILDHVGFREPRTHQYEYSRLFLDYTVLSKRKLIRLVKEGHVEGWDDPRMPTVAGLRRRGVTPEAIRTFALSVGVTKVNARTDYARLEHAVREDLNPKVPRVMAVLRPLKVVVTNFPEGEVEALEAPLYPHDVPLEGSRTVPFSRELWIDREDFMEEPPRGYRRLRPGGEVRLRYAYFLRCDEVVKDPETGEVVELRCTYDPETRTGAAPDGRKVQGIIHWVSAAEALPATVRLYDRLFSVPDPDDVPEGGDFTDHLNPDSLEVLEEARVEPWLGKAQPEDRFQFERTGYFVADRFDSLGGEADQGRLVFNRIVTLRDSWAKRMERAGGAEGPGADQGPAGAGGAAREVSRSRGSEGAAGSETAREGAPEGPGRRRSSGRDDRDAARAGDPELAARFERYRTGLGLTEEEADLLSGSRASASFFDAAVECHDNPRGIASWLVNEFPRVAGDRELGETRLDPQGLGALVALLDADRVSRPAAREIFEILVEAGGDPGSVMRERGLEQVSDPSALRSLVERALASNPDKVREYREGKRGLLGFFMGQVMREAGGTADPTVVRELLEKMLDQEEVNS